MTIMTTFSSTVQLKRHTRVERVRIFGERVQLFFERVHIYCRTRSTGDTNACFIKTRTHAHTKRKLIN